MSDQDQKMIDGLPVEKEVVKKPSDNLKPGDDRFDTIYGKMKHFERDNNQLKDAMQELTKHNKKVVSAMEQISEEAKTKTEQIEVAKVDNAMAELQTKFNTAVADEDVMGALVIQNQINDERAKVSKASADKTVEKVAEKVKTATTKMDDNRIMNKWKEENPWYIEGSDAATFADAYGRTIWSEDIDYDKFLKDVSEKTMDVLKLTVEDADQDSDDENEEEEENEKEPKMKFAAVEGGSDTGVSKKARKGKITLTPQDKKMADLFEIPYDQYAKELEFTQGGAE